MPSWPLAPSILTVFYLVLIYFPHFCCQASKNIWKKKKMCADWSHFTFLFWISSHFSVCHQSTLFPIPPLNLLWIVLDNGKLFPKGVESFHTSVSSDWDSYCFTSLPIWQTFVFLPVWWLWNRASAFLSFKSVGGSNSHIWVQ